MNPATFDAARLVDADFLYFLAAAGWGGNVGMALFFLLPHKGDGTSAGDRGFWLTVAAAFLSVAVVCAARLAGHHGVLIRSSQALDLLTHGGVAMAVLFSLAVLPHAFGSVQARVWWCGAALVAVMAAAFVLFPAMASGWWLGVGVAAAGLATIAVGWRSGPRATRGTTHGSVYWALGCMQMALGLVLGASHRVAGARNAPVEGSSTLDVAQAWQGAAVALAAVVAFSLLWWRYLDACTLPRIRARKGFLGVRPMFLLPMLEGFVLCVGSAWFLASSSQVEDYAARRLRAEVATVMASLDVAEAAVAVEAREPQRTRAVLERILQRSSSFVVAIAWSENPPGKSGVIATVARAGDADPVDPAWLAPRRDDLDHADGEVALRWVHEPWAFERAIVTVRFAGESRPPWFLSLVVDSRDLASLVATHRFQALAILALAVLLVAFAVVYTVRTFNEAELRLLKESAEAENNGRNAFLGMISHEIRTPLQSVLGYAELAEGTGLSEAAGRQVRAIRTQGAILLRIVQDILDFSAMRGGGLTLNPEAVSLRELLDDVQRGMAGRAQAKGIVFSTEIDGAVPAWVMVDRVRLTQVLLNLAVNAVKFTDRGGVRVATSCRGVVDGRATIEILVSDTGPGISVAQMRRLFEPFRKMRDDDTPGGGGVGLGLAISRQIVELLGGTIEVESVDGEGSVFRLRLDLPVAAAGMARPVGALALAASARIPSLAGLRVLLIDDNPYVRDLLRDFLHRLGAAVAVRADGRSGLDACGREVFDVILLDLRLPDFRGADIAARLRATGRSPTDPWIVGISAGVSDAEIQATLERGVNDFMLKPVSMGGLAETIRMSPAAAKIAPDARVVSATADGLSADQRAAFFAELEPMFDRLEQSCLEEQGARLGAEAHYLANGCMVTGFDEGLNVCREIEQLAEAGAFAAARQRIAELRSRFAAGGAGACGA